MTLQITRPPDKQLCQGDLFSETPWSIMKEVKFLQGSGDKFVTATARPSQGHKAQLATHGGIGNALLLSHDCVIDKDKHSPLAFARVLPMSICDARMAQATREGRNLQAFHIPADSMCEECYVDFRMIFAMTPNVVRELRRVASLTKSGQDSLQHALITYWTRKTMKQGIWQRLVRFFK